MARLAFVALSRDGDKLSAIAIRAICSPEMWRQFAKLPARNLKTESSPADEEYVLPGIFNLVFLHFVIEETAIDL